MSTTWGQPPVPQPAPKKPWFKKKRFVIPLGTFVALMIIGILSPTPEPEVKIAAPAATSQPAQAEATAAKKSTTATTPAAPEPTKPPPPAPKPKKTRELTSGEANAIDKAEEYLQYSAFSRKGLIRQLKFEGFSTREATYAVDHISVNWNKQAAKKAKEYLENGSFSKAGLIHQLEFEGFTSSQAKHGAAVAY